MGMSHAINMQTMDRRIDDASAVPGCPNCGAGPLASRTVDTLFWQGERPVMIRGIPALLCMGCGEEFISDDTAARLDGMKRDGFLGPVAEHLTVPVFRFRDRRGGGAD